MKVKAIRFARTMDGTDTRATHRPGQSRFAHFFDVRLKMGLKSASYHLYVDTEIEQLSEKQITSVIENTDDGEMTNILSANRTSDRGSFIRNGSVLPSSREFKTTIQEEPCKFVFLDFNSGLSPLL